MTQPDTLPLKDEVKLVMHELTPRIVEVVQITDLAIGMRRVVFAGSELSGFRYVHMAPDDHVKLSFPSAETGEIVMPVLGPQGVERPDPNGPQPIFRDYTVRAFDPEKLELTIDFVLHTHGVGGSWAAGAQPGDRLGVLGPRGSHVYPVGYDWYLLAADETALPAIGRWFEELPVDREVVAFIEVADPEHEVPLPPRPGATVRYVHRAPAEPGKTELLHKAIREYEFPSGEMFAWVAGEANSLKPIRRYLRRELGVEKKQVKVDGYWRCGTVNHDHHEPEDDD
ncbi:siderophore-interacting protein [Rhodococcus sp. NPDC058521]|uniref:siderophore-interacting protein n=1 Tax=Rhodococcus sp. NPDC058521 TaxID=3346536 RepID=UPI00364C5DA9